MSASYHTGRTERPLRLDCRGRVLWTVSSESPPLVVHACSTAKTEVAARCAEVQLRVGLLEGGLDARITLQPCFFRSMAAFTCQEPNDKPARDVM